MLLEPSKSQQNSLFYRIVWPGLNPAHRMQFSVKIPCDALRCIFQQVGNFVPDFGISQPIILFSNVFYDNAGDLMRFDMFIKSVRYIFLNDIAAMKIAAENGNLPL